jgi:hypothetical protein
VSSFTEVATVCVIEKGGQNVCIVFYGKQIRTQQLIFSRITYFWLDTVLPDGIFSYQISQLEYILEGLGMENVGIFKGHLEYFTAIW